MSDIDTIELMFRRAEIEFERDGLLAKGYRLTTFGHQALIWGGKYADCWLEFDENGKLIKAGGAS